MSVTSRRPSGSNGATRPRRRWWVLRAFGRNPLVRTVDRAEAWAVVGVLVGLFIALFIAADVSDAIEASELRVIQVEASQRHPVDAVATSASEQKQQGTAVVNRVNVRWFGGAQTQERTVRVQTAVASGEPVRLWFDDAGQIRPAPRDAADAVASGIGAGVILWLAIVALATWALTVLRRLLDRRRARGWDRALQTVVGNGGGSTAHNP